MIKMNNSITGPIFLSPDNSIEIHPGKEYMKERNKFFENLASNMKIHRVGTDCDNNYI